MVSEGSIDTWKPEVIGETLTGWLRQVLDSVSTETESTYKRYIFDTGANLVQCAPGKQVDEILGDGSKIGQLIQLKWQGKIPLSRGRSMNSYTIRRIETSFKG